MRHENKLLSRNAHQNYLVRTEPLLGPLGGNKALLYLCVCKGDCYDLFLHVEENVHERFRTMGSKNRKVYNFANSCGPQMYLASRFTLFLSADNPNPPARAVVIHAKGFSRGKDSTVTSR